MSVVPSVKNISNLKNAKMVQILGEIDDVARRREARRRKILQNSQNRLQKITGSEEIPTTELPWLQGDTAPTPTEDPPAPKPTPPKSDPPIVSKVQSRNIRTIIISALALFVNVQLFIWERLLEVDLNSTYFNKIFMPFLTYVTIEYFTTSQSAGKSKSFVYIVLEAKAGNSHLVSLLKIMDLLGNVFQDVMLYFFVFVSSEVVKELLYVLIN